MASKALLVGINDYQNVRRLRGCHRDVDNLRDLLTSTFGFEDSRVNRLRGSDVRRDELLWRMDWLLRGVEAGDQLVFHFSGHGSYVHDNDGDEPDGLDELLCLWDYPQGYLIDDELREWTSRCPEGVHLTVILDTCHSGTGTRFGGTQPDDPGDIITEPDPSGVPPRPRPVVSRFVEPRGSSSDPRPAEGRSGGEADMNHLLLAGARADQESGDAPIAGAWQGVFTYYLCAVARHYAGQVTYKKLIDVVNLNLRQRGYAQVPQLEGPDADKDRHLFK